MKALFFIVTFLSFIFSYSQEYSKYDDSYGVFELNFMITAKGKAQFKSIEVIKCKDCSEELINNFKSNTIRAFNKTTKKYEEQYSSNKKDIKFKLPIIMKIEDLEREYRNKWKKLSINFKNQIEYENIWTNFWNYHMNHNYLTNKSLQIKNKTVWFLSRFSAAPELDRPEEEYENS